MPAALHHVESGPTDAPVVVLSSSLGTTGAMWQPQLPALAEHVRVLAVDHRGHGGSEVVPAAATIGDLGADVVALLDRLGVERFSWAGLSLGGMVGMWVASHLADRVDRLALLCTAAALPPADAWRERATLVRAGGTVAVADAVLARWFTPAFADRHPDVVGTYRSMLLATPAAGYAACCDAIAGMDLRGDLPAITASTLVVAATDDPATPPPLGEEIASLVPDSRLEIVDDAAHLANVQQPDVVTTMLLDHLATSR